MVFIPQCVRKRPLIKELHLGGGTPTFFSPENLTTLIEGIFQLADVAKDAELSFEGHPNNTTKAHLQALYNLGFKRVCFGVQDYNPTVQKAINRVQTFEQVQQVTQLAREIGYTSVGHDIIYGLPFQTLDHVKNTIANTALLQPDRIAYYSYAHVPWKKGNGQRGFKDADLPTSQEKKQQYEFGKKWLLQEGYQDIGMDHFALPTDSLYKASKNGELHRNFMGYTTSKSSCMIGLGASSISDSWKAFAQNVKSIEEYQHLVDNGILPVYRGHLLTQEDLLIRQHILNLMCRFETTWEVEALHQVDFQNILNNLAEFEADGLVLLGTNSILVTEKANHLLEILVWHLT